MVAAQSRPRPPSLLVSPAGRNIPVITFCSRSGLFLWFCCRRSSPTASPLQRFTCGRSSPCTGPPFTPVTERAETHTQTVTTITLTVTNLCPLFFFLSFFLEQKIFFSHFSVEVVKEKKPYRNRYDRDLKYLCKSEFLCVFFQERRRRSCMTRQYSLNE